MGFLGLEVEEEYGGMGLDFLYLVIFCEEMGKIGSFGFDIVVVVYSYLVMNYLIYVGFLFIKDKYLRLSVIGEKIGFLFMIEFFVGFDFRGICVIVILDGDYYIVNGLKIFIFNGFYGDYMVVVVKIECGMFMLVMDLDVEGVLCMKLDKVGICILDMVELVFDNV